MNMTRGYKGNPENQMEDRKTLEAKFHDMRERDRKAMSSESFLSKYSNKKYYSITRMSDKCVDALISKYCRNATVLDYCCGLGRSSVRLAQVSSFVHGIDISAESINTARMSASDEGISDKTRFEVMDAENLNYDNNTFDVVYCCGVLHHLDLGKAYSEISRVIKPSGIVICHEALGHNPLINLYRRMTPRLRTAWEADHIMRIDDVKLAGQYFRDINVEYYHLATLIAVPLRNTRMFDKALSALEWVDSCLLALPPVRKMAWQAVFTLSGPLK